MEFYGGWRTRSLAWEVNRKGGRTRFRNREDTFMIITPCLIEQWALSFRTVFKCPFERSSFLVSNDQYPHCISGRNIAGRILLWCGNFNIFFILILITLVSIGWLFYWLCDQHCYVDSVRAIIFYAVHFQYFISYLFLNCVLIYLC